MAAGGGGAGRARSGAGTTSYRAVRPRRRSARAGGDRGASSRSRSGSTATASARLRAALRAVPEPSPIVARARVGDALDDVDFYELGRFADALDALARAWDAARRLRPAARPPVLDGLRVALAPGRDGARGAGFYLADAFDPGLHAARSALAAAEAAVEARREAVAARVRDALGVDPVGEEFVCCATSTPGRCRTTLHVVRETPTYRVAGDPGRLRRARRRARALDRGRRAGAPRSRGAGRARSRRGHRCDARARRARPAAGARRVRAALGRLRAGVRRRPRSRSTAATFAPLADALAARGHRYTPLVARPARRRRPDRPEHGRQERGARDRRLPLRLRRARRPAARARAALPLLDALVCIGGEGPADARAPALVLRRRGRARARNARAASPRTLVLVDEFARTTGPREGRALLVAFVEALRARGAFALVATHFDGVAAAAGVPHLRIAGLREHGLAAVGANDLDAALDAINAAMDYRVVARRRRHGNVRRAGAGAAAGTRRRRRRARTQRCTILRARMTCSQPERR